MHRIYSVCMRRTARPSRSMQISGTRRHSSFVSRSLNSSDAVCLPVSRQNALLQAPDTATLSDPLIITLLPALPAEKWSHGSLRGARIRGGLILDFTWKDGAPSEAHFIVKGSKTLHRYAEVMYAGNVVAKFETAKANSVVVKF